MSQQTQISRVVERYGPFMKRFPTPDAMAESSPSDVLRMWSGMGYNQRGLRLQQAAKFVTENGWPDDLEELPGVGPYTAAAVGSICFGYHAAAIDTNVRRVVSRWIGQALDGAHLQSAANELLDDDAATWNQAVMDLGATFCTPKPACDGCPIETWCTNPSIYVPPPRQAKFEGSTREARGAIVRVLADSPQALSVDDLAGIIGIDRDRIHTACASLVTDQLVVGSGARYALPA